jgi:hypothetical protein
MPATPKRIVLSLHAANSSTIISAAASARAILFFFFIAFLPLYGAPVSSFEAPKIIVPLFPYILYRIKCRF